MGLIKSADVPGTVAGFSMRDIEKQARALLLQARRRAEQILAAAQAEAEELRRQARSEGFSEGHEAGVAKGREEGIAAGRQQALEERRAELDQLAQTLAGAMMQLNRSRLELEASAVHDVLGLSIAIAERVTKRMGALDPAVAVANVAEAMKLVGHASDVRIAVHPAQRAALEEALPELRRQWTALQHVELVEDGSLAPGGCRVFTAAGHVDGDLDEQLGRIVRDLLPAAQEGP